MVPSAFAGNSFLLFTVGQKPHVPTFIKGYQKPATPQFNKTKQNQQQSYEL
jgi:hypothetical protein